MPPPETPQDARNPAFTGGKDPMPPVFRIYAWLQTGDVPDSTIARALEINPAHLHRLREGRPDYFSPVLIKAFLGQDWGMMRVVWQEVEPPAPDDQDQRPAYIILRYPPRQCPVTDLWFIPRQSNERFYPGLPERIKRAARRDVARARKRWAQSQQNVEAAHVPLP